MAYAPHSNEPAQIIDEGRHIAPLIRGMASHRDASYEYADRRHCDPLAGWAPWLPHIIYTADGPRAAEFTKTTIRIATDESEFGQPVMLTIPRVKFRPYNTPSWWTAQGLD